MYPPPKKRKHVEKNGDVIIFTQVSVLSLIILGGRSHFSNIYRKNIMGLIFLEIPAYNRLTANKTLSNGYLEKTMLT